MQFKDIEFLFIFLIPHKILKTGQKEKPQGFYFLNILAALCEN